MSTIRGLAPLLKPSILEKLSTNLSENGIDISNIVSLSEYLNSESVINLLEKTDTIAIDEKMIEQFMPFLNESSKARVFEMILEGRLDYRLIKYMLPYYMSSLL